MLNNSEFINYSNYQYYICTYDVKTMFTMFLAVLKHKSF